MPVTARRGLGFAWSQDTVDAVQCHTLLRLSSLRRVLPPFPLIAFPDEVDEIRSILIDVVGVPALLVVGVLALCPASSQKSFVDDCSDASANAGTILSWLLMPPLIRQSNTPFRLRARSTLRDGMQAKSRISHRRPTPWRRRREAFGSPRRTVLGGCLLPKVH